MEELKLPTEFRPFEELIRVLMALRSGRKPKNNPHAPKMIEMEMKKGVWEEQERQDYVMGGLSNKSGSPP